MNRVGEDRLGESGPGEKSRYTRMCRCRWSTGNVHGEMGGTWEERGEVWVSHLGRKRLRPGGNRSKSRGWGGCRRKRFEEWR